MISDTPQPPILLAARSVTANYGDGPDVFCGVDISVRQGQLLSIVGPNGAGKSTLLAVLAGVLKPRAGQVQVSGVDLADLPAVKRAQIIGYLPQSVQPFSPYRVRELIALGRYPHARGLGFETGADRRAVEEAMTLVRVSHLRARSFARLSGGERQRVLIASVLAAQPEVLLLDEPTAALDIGQRSSVFATLKRLAARGAAVAVVTHDLNLAGLFSDQIVLIADRQILASGQPSAVINGENLGAAYGDGFVLVSRPDSVVPGVLPAELRSER